MVKVSKIIEYPHYDTKTTDSDIALLKLSKPVKFTDEILPACLPTDPVKVNTRCYVTGWGDTKGTMSSSKFWESIKNWVIYSVMEQL